MFNLAVQWKMRPDNPAMGFHRRVETERERYLSMDEIDRLAKALGAAEDQRAANIIRLCMLTGARLGEVRCARFRAVQSGICHMVEACDHHQAAQNPPPADFAGCGGHRAPEANGRASGVSVALPRRCAGQPVKEIRCFWRQVQTKAGISGVRIHDLRHTFASLLVSGGASLEMIGKLLGHSQMRTTQRYAHMMDSPLRDGVNAVADMMKPQLALYKVGFRAGAELALNASIHSVNECPSAYLSFFSSARPGRSYAEYGSDPGLTRPLHSPRTSFDLLL